MSKESSVGLKFGPTKTITMHVVPRFLRSFDAYASEYLGKSWRNFTCLVFSTSTFSTTRLYIIVQMNILKLSYCVNVKILNEQDANVCLIWIKL